MKRTQAALLSLLMATALPRAALAGDWTASFIAPDSPTATLRIDLPDEVDLVTLTMLGAELDGIDITSLLSLDGNDFTYTPPGPLAAGGHSLRLVVFNPDGTTGEKGRWSFSVSGDAAVAAAEADQAMTEDEAWLRGTSFSSNNSLELSQRIATQHLNGLPHETLVSGAGDMTTRTTSGNWTYGGDANYLVMSDPAFAQNGNPVDLGEYNLFAEYGGEEVAGALRLGHHDIGLENTLFSAFNRRGLSAALGRADARAEMKLFTMHPESISGAAHPTGIDDSQSRVDGAAFSVRPFSAAPGALRLTGTLYDGEGGTGGTGATSIDGAATGRGWGAKVEKGFADGRMNLRGEYAGTRYDADGSGTNATDDSGNAVAVSAEIRPFTQPPTVFQRTLDVMTGLKYEKISTFFRSLGNAGLAGDREAITGTANMTAGALSCGMEYTHQTNNVDGLLTAPRDRLHSFMLNTSYTFDRQDGGMSWLGTPYLNATGQLSDARRLNTPTGYIGPNTDNDTHALTLGGGANYEDWGWSVSQTLSRFDDHAAGTGDTMNGLTGLGVNWNASDRFSLNGGIEYGVNRQSDSSQNVNGTNITLGGTAVIIPDKVNTTFDYNLNLSAGGGDTPDRNVLNGEVEWVLLPADRNTPGIALALRGSMEDINNDETSLTNGTRYQVFSVLRFKAPFALDR